MRKIVVTKPFKHTNSGKKKKNFFKNKFGLETLKMDLTQ